MTIHLHRLLGCSPTPLAHYLKAIGILRIVAQQKDPDARGFWRDENFCLLSNLDRYELKTFLLDEYAPTSIFNPWGARSGFYGGSSEKSARESLEKIEVSLLPRLAHFRDDIIKTRGVIGKAGGSKPDDDATKNRLLIDLHKTIRGPGSEWLAAVLAVVGDDIRSPAIWGTGGNEGSGGYPSAYYGAIVDCLLAADRSGPERALARALYGHEATHPNSLWSGTFGQFIPNSHGTAWDLLFCFEGAVAFRSGVTRRRSSPEASNRLLSSPFFFLHEAMGSGSDATIDEYSLNKGRWNPGRGEQWFPLWDGPSTYVEVSSLLSESRCSNGRHRARSSLDVALAIGRQGVARGVSHFVRYGYLQRNNQATHFAVPLGRLSTHDRPSSLLVQQPESAIRVSLTEIFSKG